MKKQAIQFLSILGLLVLILLVSYFAPKPNISQNNLTTQLQPLTSEESAVVQSVNNALPSVVTIGINTTINTLPQITPQQLNQNIGSGFIVSSDGLIITNKHVVSDISATYRVITNDNKRYDATKIYRDPLNDLAIIKINANNLKSLIMGDSSKLQLGQTAIAIGTPFGEFKNTVTTGVISGLNRGINAGSPFQGSVEMLSNVIQTDAPINPGNSGGPLLNSSGQVIGINTAVSLSGSNLGFAIPINTAKDLLNAFKNAGENFQQPYLGVRYTMLDQTQAAANNLVQGAYIIEVVPGSPADKGGIKQNDVITNFDGNKIDSINQDLTSVILKHKVGEKISVAIWRNGQTISVQVTLQAIP